MTIVTKEQIIRGCMHYIKDKIVPCVASSNTQIIIGTAINMFASSPQFIDNLFNNSKIPFILAQTEEGKYDIDILVLSLSQTLSEQNNKFKVELGSPESKLLTRLLDGEIPTFYFDANDIKEIRSYIVKERDNI